jgi:uncharacterized cupin superfamily protein
MLDYTTLKDKGGLEPWPAFKDLPFAKVLEGNPVHEGRFDLGGFGTRTMAGVWQCTRGKFEYTYPGDEICTLLEGHIRVTDKDGKVHDYRAGDTFFTSKGEFAIWEIVEPVKKVFFIHDLDAEQLAA